MKRQVGKMTVRTRIAALALSMVSASSVMAFTQLGGGGALPMGHEWLTRTSALEVLDAEHIIAPDPQDPRIQWDKGLAKNLDLTTAQGEVERLTSRSNNNALYEPRFDDINSAIVGERWVDMAGFNVAKSMAGKHDCFDAVAQEPADLQKDHFMRRYDDMGGQGGVDAASRSQQRFIRHFVSAAMAESKRMNVWDGGAYSSSANVNHNYFLFGRAVHLFQDSFSPEHTVRLAEDNYEKVRQVKAYLCSEGAEQHVHAATAALSFASGDVIWKEKTRLDAGWDTYKVSSMKNVALVAMEASKDLWAAFIRTMAVPHEQRESAAYQEAQTLVDNWLSFDEQEMLSWYENEDNRDATYVLEEGQSGFGKTQFECMTELGVESGSQSQKVSELEEERRQCLYNVKAAQGYSDLNDPLMHIPYNWQWTSIEWKTPPADWVIPILQANTGKTVTIANSINGEPLSASSGLKRNSTVYSRSGEPVVFTAVKDSQEGVYFRANNNPDLFLSYSGLSGKAKLYNSPNQAAFKVEPLGVLWSIENTYWDDFLWFNESNEKVYLTGEGNTDKAHSRWIINGL